MLYYISRRVSREGLAQRTLACDEGDELAHTLLHTFLCFFGDFGILGQGHLHDSGDWSKVTNVSVRSCPCLRVIARVLRLVGGRCR